MGLLKSKKDASTGLLNMDLLPGADRNSAPQAIKLLIDQPLFGGDGKVLNASVMHLCNDRKTSYSQMHIWLDEAWIKTRARKDSEAIGFLECKIDAWI